MGILGNGWKLCGMAGKRVVTNTLSRKLQENNMEFDFDNFEITSRFIIP